MADQGLVTSLPGLPFLNISGAEYVIAGGLIPSAFHGGSSGGPGGVDDANSGNSITWPDNTGLTMTMSFSLPIGNPIFDVADVQTTSGGWPQTFTAQAYDAPVGGNLLHTVIVNPGDPGTGDGLLTPVDFRSGFAGTNQIQRLEMSTAQTFPFSD
ncbi:MAG: hypothetical protein AAF492_03135, partial [Verrucomicrobiota bacterium]